MKVLAIVGPTGMGKTALSVELAKRYNGEIISGDSLQVYRKLDIGTAKVTPEEMQGIKHHLIDICDYWEDYSVADFQKMARQAIEEIHSRGKLPIVVGGTGLYIQALLYDYQLGGKVEATDFSLRNELEEYGKIHGNLALWEKLAKKDPVAADKIHYNNRRKVIRALEVFQQTGSSIAEIKEPPKKCYDFFLIGLDTQREVLYNRINLRVEEMFANGLEKEARLLENYETVQAAKGIGYREFFPYFKGKITLAEVKELIKQDSRRYAKRQLTWFRNRMEPRWADLVLQKEQISELEVEIHQWLEESTWSKKNG